MRRFCLVLAVLSSCFLALSASGCSGDSSAATTAATAEETTTTTAKFVPSGVWTDLNPTGDLPAPRVGHSIAYEPVGGRLILFGGWNGKQDFGDTWAYDPPTNSWTALTPVGKAPSARHDHVLAYDPESRKLILFGGTSVAAKFAGLNDTWAYDPAANTWEQLSPAGDLPLGRSVHCLAYHPGVRQMILFGGSDRGSYLNDTWAYDPATMTWRESSPVGDLPPRQCAGSFVYDGGLDRLVLFGGWNGTYLADTWVYDPVTENWARLNPVGRVPTGRHSFGLAYDSNVHRSILFGGWQDAALDENWNFDSEDRLWAQVDPAGEVPPPRFGFTLVFDPDRRVVFLFGGSDDTTLFNDTWSYNAAR